MSRVNISITERKTDEWIINEKFCRTPALEFFCKNSNNEKLQGLFYDIVMGIDLDKDNIGEYLEIVQYVITTLNDITPDKRSDYFPVYKEDIYNDFIRDLTNSLAYLNDFIKKNNLEDYLIEITQ